MLKDRAVRTQEAKWWGEDDQRNRLGNAVEVCERHCIQQPPRADLVAHAENVSGWVSMTAAHSIVEQALKAVLNKRGRPEARQRGKTGHDLSFLYAALPVEDKQVVECAWLDFARRVQRPPWSGAAEFLDSVAHDYERWRYVLIEVPPDDLSTTHPEALLTLAKGLLLCLSLDRPRTTRKHQGRAASTPSQQAEVRDGESGKRRRTEPDLVRGLRLALKSLKQHLNNNESLLGSTDPDQPQSAFAWLAITCAFPLLEQAIKELLDRRGIPTVKRRGPDGHDINTLLTQLPEPDQALVARGFATYASLFDEIEHCDALAFLRDVGRSYNDWRYALIQRPGREIAAAHPGALLEIAHLVIKILRNETSTNQGIQDLGGRLETQIRMEMNRVRWDRSLRAQDAGLPAVPTDALQAWFQRAPNVLTGFAAFLRGELPESAPVAEFLKETETNLLRATLPDSYELRRYMACAKEGAGFLSWDPVKHRFCKS